MEASKEKKVNGALLKGSFYNNPFIGLFIRASDKHLAVPRDMPEKLLKSAEQALRVPVFRTSISQSHLLGIFTVMNSNGVIISSLAEKQEMLEFKKQGLNVEMLDPFSPGNNIVCNDHAALASHNLSPNEIKRVEDCLGVEVHQHRFATPAVITSTVATNKGFVTHNELTESEIKLLERMFKVPGQQATVNGGTIYNSIGCVANSHGALVGESTTGFEVQRVYSALFG